MYCVQYVVRGAWYVQVVAGGKVLQRLRKVGEQKWNQDQLTRGGTRRPGWADVWVEL